MSTEQMTRGIEMIASAAEKAGMHLGSRAVDLFRGIIRVSFEKEIEIGSRCREPRVHPSWICCPTEMLRQPECLAAACQSERATARADYDKRALA